MIFFIPLISRCRSNNIILYFVVVKNVVQSTGKFARLLTFMKVLFIHPFIQLGGGEKVIIRLCNYFIKKNHTVSIVCLYRDTHFVEKIDTKIQWHMPPRVISSILQKNRLFLICFGMPILAILTIIHSFSYDLLFPHNFPSVLFAACAKIFSHKPILFEFNEQFSKMWGLSYIETLAGRFSDFIIVLDKKNERTAKDTFLKPAEIIHPGIDYAYWSGRTSKDKKYAQKTLIISVGKLHIQKNQIILLSAVKQLIPKIPNIHLVLIGKGPDEKRIRGKMQLLSLQKHVTLAGIVSDTTLRKFYKTALVVCFPALDQTWGLTPFEALCQRTASIVSSQAGAADILKSQQIALIAKPTASNFAQEILFAKKNQFLLKNMGRKGKAYVSRHLDWNQFCQKVLDSATKLYEKR